MKALVVPTLVFAAALFWINGDLIRTPHVEESDYAANALQVQDAKRFRTLTGNYSRWKFHHPGPVFFYAYALGEAVLHDATHLVETPFSAHLLMIMVINIVMLATAIGLMRRYWPSPWFPALAFGAALIVVGLVNHRIPGSAFVSVWPPYVLLIPFVLFAVAAASVGTGTFQHLPFMTAAGVILVHAHIAQPLFVGTLGPLAMFAGWWREGRDLRAIWTRSRRAILVSAGLIALGILPVALDILLHEPDNLDAIRAYSSSHTGREWPLKLAGQYVLSFFVFMADPHTVLLDPHGGLRPTIKDPFVQVVWAAAVVLIGAAITAWRFLARRSSPFQWVLLSELGVIFALFCYWATRITGPLFNFNGHFFFSVFILGGFVVAGVFSDAIGARGGRHAWWAGAALAASPLVVAAPFTHTHNLMNTVPMLEIAKSVESERAHKVALIFEDHLWPIAVGLASLFERQGRPYCVPPSWGFMFGRDRTCADVLTMSKLRFSKLPTQCEGPCERIAFQGSDWSMSLLRPNPRRLPFSLAVGDIDVLGDDENWYGLEAGFRWSRRSATIRFLLAPERPTAAPTLEVSGFPIEGRPVQVSLNDHLLGTFERCDQAGGPERCAAFPVPPELLHPGAPNEVRLTIAKAGPYRDDPRELGFALRELNFVAAP